VGSGKTHLWRGPGGWFRCRAEIWLLGGGLSSFLHGEDGDGFAAGLGDVGERDVVGAGMGASMTWRQLASTSRTKARA
jgi:hypothetical protein